MLQSCFEVHNIWSIEWGPIERFAPSQVCRGFCSRRLTVRDKQGNKSVVTLYADKAMSLATEDEMPKEDGLADLRLERFTHPEEGQAVGVARIAD